MFVAYYSADGDEVLKASYVSTGDTTVLTIREVLESARISLSPKFPNSFLDTEKDN